MRIPTASSLEGGAEGRSIGQPMPAVTWKGQEGIQSAWVEWMGRHPAPHGSEGQSGMANKASRAGQSGMGENGQSGQSENGMGQGDQGAKTAGMAGGQVKASKGSSQGEGDSPAKVNPDNWKARAARPLPAATPRPAVCITTASRMDRPRRAK
jgi:hypothetical protein